MKTTKLYSALEKRYKPPEWGLIREVANSTGYAAKRHADAIAMSLWPSRGLLLHGFEVKAHRGDFLKELKTPEKSAPVQKYCDRWWIVADKGVVLDGELPATWGLLVRHGARLICKREAPELNAEPIDRSFLAAIFRRLAEAQQSWIPKDKISEELQAARDEAVEVHREMQAHHEKNARRELDRVQSSLRVFEEASGIKIDRWNSGNVGRAVKLVLGGDASGVRKNLEKMASTADGIAASIRERLEEA